MKKIIIFIGVTLLVTFIGDSLGWTQMEEGDFIVHFDRHGNVKSVALTPTGEQADCKIEAKGAQVFEILNEKISRHTNMEKKSHSIITLSGSPDCIFYLNNYPICICCP